MAGPYTFSGLVILDPVTGLPSPGGTVHLYDPTDTGFATPVAITGINGDDLGTTLTGGALGWTGDFTLASLKIARAKGGDPGDLTVPASEVLSAKGIAEDSTAAMVFAAAAQVAAEAAAVSAAGALAPADAVVAALVADGASDTRTALDAIFSTTGGSDPDAVKLTGAQTVAGVKTFSSAPVVPDGSWSIADTSGLQGALDAKATTTDLTTTAGAVAGKITETTYNNNNIVFVPVGGTVPSTSVFPSGLIIQGV